MAHGLLALAASSNPVWAGISGLAFIALPVAAHAQPTDEGDPVREETIVVTGERIARSRLDTFSSVTVITSDAIEAASADRLDMLLATVPNLQMGSGEEGPAIRGQDTTGQLRNLSAYLGGARPRVTLQIDGRPASSYELISGINSVWDVAQVEVFRSPQTTTQGRNSIAGAIFVTTSSPTDVWEMRARAIIAEQDTRQLSAVVSGPLAGEELTFRISGDWSEGATASDMADAIADANINEEKTANARIKLLYEPGGSPGTRVEATFAHTKSRGPQFEGVTAPFRERRLPIPQQSIGVMDVRVDSLVVQASGEIAPDLKSTVTLSTGDVRLQRFGLPGLGRTRADTRDFSSEAILDWRPAEGISGLLGTSRLYTRQSQYIDITGLRIGEGEFDDRQDSFGIFGEATFRPIGPLALTAGLRYQRDRQQRSGAVGPIGLDYDETFDAWLPKFTAAMDVTSGTTVGFTIQRAFNPGGVSLSLVQRAEDSFDAEHLWNYELFSRTSFDGGAGWLTVNAFYNDITSAQRQQLVSIVLPDGSVFLGSEFSNAPQAKTWGLELGTNWRPTRRIRVGAGLGVLRTEVRGWVLPDQPDARLEFERSPKFSGALSLDWNVTDALRLSLQARHQSGYFSGDQNKEELKVKASTVVDARVEHDFGRITLFGFARNLFDRFYMTYLFDTSRIVGAPAFGTAGAPRQVGVGVEAGI